MTRDIFTGYLCSRSEKIERTLIHGFLNFWSPPEHRSRARSFQFHAFHSYIVIQSDLAVTEISIAGNAGGKTLRSILIFPAGKSLPVSTMRSVVASIRYNSAKLAERISRRAHLSQSAAYQKTPSWYKKRIVGTNKFSQHRYVNSFLLLRDADAWSDRHGSPTPNRPGRSRFITDDVGYQSTAPCQYVDDIDIDNNINR